MPEINYIISESNLEKVRTRIAFILADELSEQAALIQAETSPTEEMLLTLESIPERIYEERFVKATESEYSLINVVLMNNPLSDLTGFEQQTDKARFNIEVYTRGVSEDGKEGDTQAAIKLQRLLMLCRHILMSPYYTTLGFEPGIIGSRVASDLEIIQPDKGIENGYIINGQFSLIVKVLETQQKITGVPLLESGTTHRLFDTNKGFYYQINT
jgi:hypothetical protein